VSEAEAPLPPTGLEAEPLNETSVHLSWKQATSSVGAVTSYTVVYTAFISAANNLSRLSLDNPSTSSVIRYAILNVLSC